MLEEKGKQVIFVIICVGVTLYIDLDLAGPASFVSNNNIIINGTYVHYRNNTIQY